MAAILGTVLAAGAGSRFGAGNELLATVDGEAVVRRAARSLAVDAVGRTLAVVGHDAAAVGDALGEAVDETIVNPEYADGQGTSVGLAARRARESGADAIVYVPGDMPLVAPATTRRLIAVAREARDSGDGCDAPTRHVRADAVVPTFEGRRGNPVLFDAGQFDALEALSGDAGGRALFDGIDVRRVPVDDPGIHADVDTVDDLARVREIAERD